MNLSYRDLEIEADALRQKGLELLGMILNELHDPKTREHFDEETYPEAKQIVSRAVDLGLFGGDPLPLDQFDEEREYLEFQKQIEAKNLKNLLRNFQDPD